MTTYCATSHDQKNSLRNQWQIFKYLLILIRRVNLRRVLISVRFVPHFKLGYKLIGRTSSLELKSWEVGWLVCLRKKNISIKSQKNKTLVKTHCCAQCLFYAFRLQNCSNWIVLMDRAHAQVGLCSCLHQMQRVHLLWAQSCQGRIAFCLFYNISRMKGLTSRILALFTQEPLPSTKCRREWRLRLKMVNAVIHIMLWRVPEGYDVSGWLGIFLVSLSGISFSITGLLYC